MKVGLFVCCRQVTEMTGLSKIGTGISTLETEPGKYGYFDSYNCFLGCIVLCVLYTSIPLLYFYERLCV